MTLTGVSSFSGFGKHPERKKKSEKYKSEE
jgi:hypothetical protein